MPVEMPIKSRKTSTPGVLIVGLSSEGKILFANDECRKVLNYPVTELVDRSFWEISPEEEKEAAEEFFIEASRKGSAPARKIVWSDREGEEHQINWQIIQLGGVSKDSEVIMAVGVDITSLAKTERRLEEFENIYEKLAGGATIPVYIAQPSSEGLIVQFASSGLEKIFGYEEGELEGKRLEDLIRSDDLSLLEKNIRKIEEDGERMLEVRGVNKSGEEISVKNRVSLVTYGGEPVILGIVEEKGEEREKLTSGPQPYRELVDFVQIGIGILQEGEIVYLNDQIAENFECSKDELRKLGFAHFIHPEDKEKLELPFREKLSDGDLPLSMSFRAITKEGEVKYLNLHATSIEYQKKPAIQLIIGDMTEQKETERKLRNQGRELRQAYKYLRETESELGKKTEQLKEANEMRSRFMDLLAHELRSYLTPIKTYIGTMKDGDLGDLTSKQNQKLKEVENKLDKINQVVGDTLDIARVEADRVKISEESIYLPDMIEEIINEVTPELESKNHDLITDVTEDLPVINGDPRLLQKVFRNLVSNAIQYTPDGGKIMVDLSRAADGVHAKISDTGIGISEEEQERIFQKFYRGGGELNGQSRGLGMGLTITKYFVELHDGEIWVESTKGEGSTFHVKLPKNSSS